MTWRSSRHCRCPGILLLVLALYPLSPRARLQPVVPVSLSITPTTVVKLSSFPGIMSSTASSSIAECSGDPACPSNGGDDDEKPTIDSDPPYCEIAGQNDYYGFGVRLGIYCSWVTSWIANNFLPGEMSVSFDTNSIFLAAISVTVLSYLHKDRIPIIDALIMQQLGSGFVLSVMSLWSYRTRYYRKRRRGGNGHFGGWGTHCRLILCAAISLYSSWFWIHGISWLLRQHPDLRRPCGGLRHGCLLLSQSIPSASGSSTPFYPLCFASITAS